MRRFWIPMLCIALLTGCAETDPASETADTSETVAAKTTSDVTNTTAIVTAVTETADQETPIDLRTWTEDDFLHISDEDLIALGGQLNLGVPYISVRSGIFPAADNEDYIRLAAQSAADRSAAQQIAEQFADRNYKQPPAVTLTQEEAGHFWCYEVREINLIVFDAAFFDAETNTLCADVTAENLLLLAAVQPDRYNPCVGMFVHDEGDSLCCTLYYISCCGGDYGMSDTAALASYAIYADKETGVLEGYPFAGLPNARAETVKELEIPGTYHRYPGEE